jgi:2'-5' RNA ligase
MSEQLFLFEAPPPPALSPLPHPVFNLVLAVFPDHQTALQISDRGSSLRKTNRMFGRMRPPHLLHVSLPIPGRARTPLEALIESLFCACQEVTATTDPFEMRFDRVMSFRGRPGNHPLVLVNDKHGNDGIMKLYGLLLAEFAKYMKAAVPKSQFVPHLTLLYDKQELAPRSIEPVRWTVREISLVASEVGATKYHPIKRWEIGR